MTRGNNLNSKHDEWEFTRLNIVWFGTVLDRIFWIGIIGVEIFRVGIIMVGILQVEIVQLGVILSGNFLGGSYPGWEFSLVGVFWVGIVQWESSGWQFSG